MFIWDSWHGSVQAQVQAFFGIAMYFRFVATNSTVAVCSSFLFSALHLRMEGWGTFAWRFGAFLGKRLEALCLVILWAPF